MISEWEQPAELVTPEGSLYFNQPIDTTTNRHLILNPRRCSSVLPVRLTDDDIPQGDGRIPHRRFRSGYRVHLAFELASDYDSPSGQAQPAQGADLVEMEDLVGLHVNAMIRTGLVPGSPNARYLWTPTGQSDDRMFDRCQLAGDPSFNYEGDLGCALYEFDFDSSFPYYMAATENTTIIFAAGSDTITNLGNTDFFPVVRVHGPFDAFRLQNNDVTDQDGNPLGLSYDSILPGAASVALGDYIEFVFWAQTAYLNGNQSNMKPGIEMTLSDFFPLVPGDNDLQLTLSGGSGTDSQAEILWNHAWA